MAFHISWPSEKLKCCENWFHINPCHRDTEELEGVIGRSRGILGYCKQYWGGYYPLLLIRMADGATPAVRKDLVDKLEAIFSSCLHTSLPQNFNKKEEAGLMDSLLRLYLHKVKLRCAESVGSHEKLGLRSTSWRCPGQCGLSVQPVSKLPSNFNLTSFQLKVAH